MPLHSKVTVAECDQCHKVILVDSMPYVVVNTANIEIVVALKNLGKTVQKTMKSPLLVSKGLTFCNVTCLCAHLLSNERSTMRLPETASFNTNIGSSTVDIPEYTDPDDDLDYDEYDGD